MLLNEIKQISESGDKKAKTPQKVENLRNEVLKIIKQFANDYSYNGPEDFRYFGSGGSANVMYNQETKQIVNHGRMESDPEHTHFGKDQTKYYYEYVEFPSLKQQRWKLEGDDDAVIEFRMESRLEGPSGYVPHFNGYEFSVQATYRTEGDDGVPNQGDDVINDMMIELEDAAGGGYEETTSSKIGRFHWRMNITPEELTLDDLDIKEKEMVWGIQVTSGDRKARNVWTSTPNTQGDWKSKDEAASWIDDLRQHLEYDDEFKHPSFKVVQVEKGTN